MVSWLKKYWVYFAIAFSIGAFLLFKNFLNDNGQALMVLITAIYVIATINISNANIKSAEATREQITESRRQFDETLRLQVIPIFQLNIDKEAETPYAEMCKDEITFTLFSHERDILCRQSCFTLSIENVGAGTAMDMSYTWHYIDQKENTHDFPEKALFQKDSVIYLINIGVEDSNVEIGSALTTELNIEYRDLLERKYLQTIHLSFRVNEKKYAMLQNYTIDKAEYIGGEHA